MQPGRFTLLLATAKACKMELLAAVIPRICLIGFTFSQPFLINRIIKLVEEPETTQSINAGYGLIGATVFIYVGMGVRLPSKSSWLVLLTTATDCKSAVSVQSVSLHHASSRVPGLHHFSQNY
jgi:hypothetical protein